MAIEIKELLIKVNIESAKKASIDNSTQLTSEVKAQIIKDCVEKVMEKLENKFER